MAINPNKYINIDVSGNDTPVVSGGLVEIVIDESLQGDGTQSNPLGVNANILDKINNGGESISELDQKIDAEKTARIAQVNSVNSTLTSAIGDEVVARQSADTALQGNIDTVAGNLSSETTARQDADTALGTRIDNEITARENADTALQNAINAETTERETDVNDLQGQIDAITAASDVTDVVGTYSALQAYNTSSLNNNDIIKVLQDETHDNETTYYRWVITDGTGAFSLIGEEGPYYTIAAADAQFVPQTRTVNGKALNGNITLSASDVGAATSADLAEYLPLTGGTLTSQINSDLTFYQNKDFMSFKVSGVVKGGILKALNDQVMLDADYLINNNGVDDYTKRLSIPTTAGTLARLEDLPSAETGTAGQVYTKTATGAEWANAPTATITVDSAIDSASSNPVENSAIAAALDGKLSTSGGTMSGVLEFDVGTADNINWKDFISIKYKKTNGLTARKNFDVLVTDSGDCYLSLNSVSLKGCGDISPSNVSGYSLGSMAQKWDTVFVTKISNGADITIPATGGTLALTSDIPTIATSVDATSTDNETVSAKLFYDTIGDIETLINAL